MKTVAADETRASRDFANGGSNLGEETQGGTRRLAYPGLLSVTPTGF
jgi:hypothetical protein